MSIKNYCCFLRTFLFIALCVLNGRQIHAMELLNENFEEGQAAASCLEINKLPTMASTWQACKDRSTFNLNQPGYIKLSPLHSHSGSTALLMNFLPKTYQMQTDVYIEKDMDIGKEVWMALWIYPAYEAGMQSEFAETNKFIYAYPPNSSTGNWCLKLGTRRYTGTDSYDATNPLPDDHTGLFASFNGTGCATTYSGQNVSDAYIHMNEWTQLVVHVNTDQSATPNAEAWLISSDGNKVQKIAEHTTSQFTFNTSTGRIKIGTSFPADGASKNFQDSWIFVDDVVIATNVADLKLPLTPPNLINIDVTPK